VIASRTLNRISSIPLWKVIVQGGDHICGASKRQYYSASMRKVKQIAMANVHHLECIKALGEQYGKIG
jgi:hypothetical protein